MGFLSKTISRAKSGDKRIEDETPFDRYLKNVEWVDMGNRNILFAKHDFPLDYLRTDNKLSFNDIKEILESLPDNISIISKSQIKWLRDNCKVIKYKIPEKEDDILYSSICCINPNTEEDIHFNLCVTNGAQEAKYFLRIIKDRTNLTVPKIEINGIGPMKFPSYLGTSKIVYSFKDEEKLYNIKLVKLKK